MSDKLEVQAALKEAIQTEKAAMDFYKYGAEKMGAGRAREVFELLAREERHHAEMFYNAYQGRDLPYFEDYIASPPDTESKWWQALQEASLSGFDERKALELALDQEDALEQQLRQIAARIYDPEIRAIYEANARSTHHHAELIEEQYREMLGMSS
jgi:rubrerythrin